MLLRTLIASWTELCDRFKGESRDNYPHHRRATSFREQIENPVGGTLTSAE